MPGVESKQAYLDRPPSRVVFLDLVPRELRDYAVLQTGAVGDCQKDVHNSNGIKKVFTAVVEGFAFRGD